ncbi:MAG: hypothetical protein IK124_01785 [Prevotella sp.]|nr:hypothetical protein [Prevotella sp.]
MKNSIILSILLIVNVLTIGAVKKTKLKILYVGGHSNIETFVNSYDKEENEKSIIERTVSFETFLHQYFTDVKVVQAEVYNHMMSYDYDVTIMDGVPSPIAPHQDVMDGQRFIKRIPAQYFPDDFDRPVITIAELGKTLGAHISPAECHTDELESYTELVIQSLS